MAGPTPTRAESDALVERINAEIEREGWGFWAVEVVGGAPFIGMGGLHRVDPYFPFAPAVEIGWRLHPAYWGHGYATEAALAALDYGFAGGLEEIVAFTAVGNVRSQAVMRRIGMERDLAADFDHPALAAGQPAAAPCAVPHPSRRDSRHVRSGRDAFRSCSPRHRSRRVRTRRPTPLPLGHRSLEHPVPRHRGRNIEFELRRGFLRDGAAVDLVVSRRLGERGLGMGQLRIRQRAIEADQDVALAKAIAYSRGDAIDPRRDLARQRGRVNRHQLRGDLGCAGCRAAANRGSKSHHGS